MWGHLQFNWENLKNIKIQGVIKGSHTLHVDVPHKTKYPTLYGGGQKSFDITTVKHLQSFKHDISHILLVVHVKVSHPSDV